MSTTIPRDIGKRINQAFDEAEAMATKKSPFQHMKSEPMTNGSQRILIKIGEVEIDAGAGTATAAVNCKRMAAPQIRALNKLLADFGSDARFEIELKDEQP